MAHYAIFAVIWMYRIWYEYYANMIGLNLHFMYQCRFHCIIIIHANRTHTHQFYSIRELCSLASWCSAYDNMYDEFHTSIVLASLIYSLINSLYSSILCVRRRWTITFSHSQFKRSICLSLSISACVFFDHQMQNAPKKTTTSKWIRSLLLLLLLLRVCVCFAFILCQNSNKAERKLMKESKHFQLFAESIRVCVIINE